MVFGVYYLIEEKMPQNILCIQRTDSSQELAEIYTAVGVLLNFTYYEDTYPTVNLEAQACGTPCITYCISGSIESVPDENMVEQHNLSDVILKINRIVQKTEL